MNNLSPPLETAIDPDKQNQFPYHFYLITGAQFFEYSPEFRLMGSVEDNRPVSLKPREPLTEMSWEVFPEGLYQFLNRFNFHYRPKKLYVTENGCSYLDEPAKDGRVQDRRRIAYLAEHFAAAHRALQSGVPLAGFFVWSFMDNFEWADGYKQRFGLVHIDFETQKRTIKDSAYWYKEVIETNGESL